jgi:NAD dependent epimerase/dehydratase family enzyme
MRIIIAGGSGLIGRELTTFLSNAGDEVTILSRKPELVLGMPPGVKILPWDGKTVKEWGNEIQYSHVVINLTGENISGDNYFPKRWTKDRKLRILKSRVDAGKVLTESITN